MSTFGENLKRERMICGYTQSEFARLIHTTQQRISEWECNKIEPTLSNIILIIKTLNITFEDLTDGIK